MKTFLKLIAAAAVVVLGFFLFASCSAKNAEADDIIAE